MVSGFQGAIIAAGRGERLRGAVNDLPKPLVELGGETMLVRQARMLHEAGAERVVALVNCETARLIAARALALPRWMELHARDTASSMESLFTLAEYLGDARHFLLATVDAVAQAAELARFVTRARGLTARAGAAGFDGALAVVRWRGDRRALFAEVAPQGNIRALGERESSLVTAGFYWLPAAMFELAPRARALELDAMRKALAMALDQGMRLAAVELAAIIDVDEAADLAAARAMLAAAPAHPAPATGAESNKSEH